MTDIDKISKAVQDKAGHWGSGLNEAIIQALRDERERCAVIAEGACVRRFAGQHPDHIIPIEFRDLIAAAIRNQP